MKRWALAPTEGAWQMGWARDGAGVRLTGFGAVTRVTKERTRDHKIKKVSEIHRTMDKT